MNEEKYLTERLEDQIDWYDNKSQHNQKWFKRLRAIEIIGASIIPFIAGFSSSIGYSEWIIGLLGVIIAVSSATSGIHKFHENWIQYRTTAETLKHEKYLYLTSTDPYDLDDKFHLLVKRIESLISKENTQWEKYIQTKSENSTSS